MEMTFIGHQSWMVSSGASHVLVDPVLGDSFGHSEPVDFRVYPPRRVRVDRMPPPTAVFLSHEHLDHFHLPSLALLPRDVPVIVGPLLPSCVSDAIEALGMRVVRQPFGAPLQVGELVLRLYPAGADTVFWESRVAQLHVQSADRSVFIAVDALIAEEFAQALARRELPVPDAVVVANNSQHPPPGARGAHSNLLPLNDHRGGNSPEFGITLLHSVLISYLKAIPGHPEVVLCGNGFMSHAESFGPFLYSDNRRLAEIANELSLRPRFHGPLPGDTLTVAAGCPPSQASWITRRDDERLALVERQQRFLADPQPEAVVPLSPELDDVGYQQAVARVMAGLRELAPAVPVSGLGRAALRVNEYLGRRLSGRRIVLRFPDGAGRDAFQVAFDLASSRFVEDATPIEALLSSFPFGVEVFLEDFAALLDGRLQIWDLAGAAMRSWYVGSMYDNVVAFLFAQYGEQVRPDLAARTYAGALERLARRIPGAR